jgi:hypothetical protein
MKIPTMMMFELIPDSHTEMTEYEAQYGEISRLEEGS